MLRYLFRDGLTLKESNFADIAHVVAASKKGPRGDDPLPMAERKKCENLLLACKKHHKLLDSKEHEEDYPVDLLREYKSEHERFIHRVTGMLPENRTAVVRFQSNIGGNAVSIGNGDIYQAISPRYPVDDSGLEIDLTRIVGTDTRDYWQTGADTISRKVELFLSHGINQLPPPHLSIFALGPIPFLMHLGHTLGSKIPYQIYQKHRSTSDWIWGSPGKVAEYSYRRISEGVSVKKVGILLSLSGSVRRDDLPKNIDSEFPLYELTLSNKKPSPMFLNRREDLEHFKETLLSMLDYLRVEYPEFRELHIFPAIPVSIAVVCGIERLPKVHPKFVIYDFNKEDQVFNKTLTLR